MRFASGLLSRHCFLARDTLDYLLKPVSQERFSATSGRAPARQEILVERLKAAYFAPVESIRHITADRNYALVYSEMGEFALRTTMDAIERRLDPAEFARVSPAAA